MIGPHYQRLAQAERQITGKQMLERVQAHTSNPLTAVIDKLKRQFTQYETAYTEDIINHQISSVDKLLSYDGKLGPILAALQKQNNLLRRELSLFQSQLSNSVGICEQLILQNNQLKQSLIQKNGDLNKIVQTIAWNQSQFRNQLQDKISILQQQNSLLIQHLQQIKKKHQQYQVKFQSKELEINKWEKKWTENKKHLNEAIEREREVTRKLAISQHFLFQQKQKYQTLQSKYHHSELERAELNRKIQLYEINNQNNDPQALRRSIQNQYLQILEEHKILKSQRQKILRDNQKSKNEKQKLQDTFHEVEKKFNKVLNEYELTSNLLSEQKTKNQTLIGTLKKLQLKLDQMKNDNVQLKIQAQASKSMIFNKQKSLYSEIDNLRKQLDQRSAQSAKILREIQVKNQQLLDTKDLQIKKLIQQNTQYRRLADRK